MTLAGLNCRIDIWRVGYGDDDAVGGAMVTGTVQYQNILARVQPSPPEQLLLQQGLETERTFRATIVPGTLTIYERDEIEVVQPTDHAYYGDRFRVIGIQISDLNRRDPRNYMILHLSRSVRAHSQQ